jgi:tetratricopeptide (TPR) repeat protein
MTMPGGKGDLGMFNAAMTLQREGRLTEAVEGYRRALAVWPELWPAAANMGQALVKLGRFDEGVRAYQQALRFNPADAKLHIGITLGLIGRGNCVARGDERAEKVAEIPAVTLCCIDTNHPEGGVFSMRESMKRARFGGAVLFASRQVDAPGINVRVIPAFPSLEDYSRFIFSRTLIDAIGTTHVLMTHWDGWVLGGGRWREEFLEFDYIGAPWPWYAESRVGNGGFSLRSRRLLECVAELNPQRVHPEDEVISRDLRLELEGRGMRFADEETAWRFAMEWRGENRAAPFGFHGLFNLRRFLSGGEIEEVLAGLPKGLVSERRESFLRGGY